MSNHVQTTTFPARVSAQVHPPLKGLALNLRFGMRKKNDFNFIAFTDMQGRIEVSGQELLQVFDQDLSIFISDYADASTNFNGEITAKVLSSAELQSAQEAWKMFQHAMTFQPNYEQNLSRAISMDPDQRYYRVELKAQ